MQKRGGVGCQIIMHLLGGLIMYLRLKLIPKDMVMRGLRHESSVMPLDLGAGTRYCDTSMQGAGPML